MNGIEDFFPILYHVLLLLVPMAPAYLFFKILPSSAAAEGPFKGLQIKLGGAFAGYFVLVLLSLFVSDPIIKAREAAWTRYVADLEKNIYQSWRVTGHLAVKPADPRFDPQSVVVFVRPPDLHIQPDAQLRFDIPILLKPDGSSDPPMLIFDAPGYQPSTVTLLEPPSGAGGGSSPVRQHFDPDRHTIVLDDPITLTSKANEPAYNPKP